MEIWTIKRPLTGLVRPCTMTVEGYPYRWIKDIARMLSSEKDCALKMLNCPCLCSPPYLPCVFPQIFVTFIYIHPREKADEASVLTRQVTQRLIYSISPDTPFESLPILITVLWKRLGVTFINMLHAWSDLKTRWAFVMVLSKEHTKLSHYPCGKGLTPTSSSSHSYQTTLRRGKKPSSNRLRSGVMTPCWASGCCDCTPPWYLLGALFCLWWSCWCFLLCGQCNPN